MSFSEYLNNGPNAPLQSISLNRVPPRRVFFVLITVFLVLTFFFIPTPSSISLNGLPLQKLPSASTALTASQLDPTKVAFMVETRPLPHLPTLFIHMMAVVPPTWSFKFFGSEESLSFLNQSGALRPYIESKKLVASILPSQYSVKDREQTSRMFTDLAFYKEILHPAENLLVFQPDSILCANSDRNLEEWLEYEWVGAPWTFGGKGGNGGLSLRKVSSIIKVLEKEKRKNDDGLLEDWWLCRRLEKLEGANMPDKDTQAAFSVESVWHDRPLGYHIGWLGVHHGQIWDDPKQWKSIMDYCPEVKMLMGMKIDSDRPF